MTVHIELFGVPRLRAGRASLDVAPGRMADVLAALAVACPALADLSTSAGRPSPHYLLSLDGDRFLGDADEWLPSGSRLLVLSADAGG